MKKLKAWLKRHIDYRITGEYYDIQTINGVTHYIKKYNKKYYLKW